MLASLLFITGWEGRRGLDDSHKRRSGDAVPVELPEPSSPKGSRDGFHSALVVELPLPAEGQSCCLCLLTVSWWVQALWRGRERGVGLENMWDVCVCVCEAPHTMIESTCMWQVRQWQLWSDWCLHYRRKLTELSSCLQLHHSLLDFSWNVREGPTACVTINHTAVWSLFTYNRLYMCYYILTFIQELQDLVITYNSLYMCYCLPSYKLILLPAQSWQLPASDFGHSLPASHLPGGSGMYW